MVNRRGEPVIMDFGLARRGGSDDRLTRVGAVLGTPAYMAPEQARGRLGDMGPGCDVYSLGVILYELLCRRLPFTGDAVAILSQVLIDPPPPPSGHCPDLDPRLEAICLKALAKKPAERYRSMAEFAAALAGYLKAAGPATASAADHGEPPPPAPPRKRSGRGWLVLAVGLVVLATLGAGGRLAYERGWFRSSPSPAPATESEPPREVIQEPAGRAVAYVWPAAALRDGKVLAPDLGKIKPWFHDTFSDPKSGFTQNKGELAERGYRNGKYVIQPTRSGVVTGSTVPLGRANLPNPSGDVACQVVGRTVAEHVASWGLGIADRTEARDARTAWARLTIGNNGRLHVRVGQGEESDAAEGPEAERLTHAAIKKGPQAVNTLLAVVQGRQVEVYVNGVAVCDPLLLEREIHVPQLSLLATSRGSTAEFESVTVWPAKDVPPLEKRGAVPKKK
jgi:hypothetical protein